MTTGTSPPRFASRAEDILRDLAASARRAAAETRGLHGGRGGQVRSQHRRGFGAQHASTRRSARRSARRAAGATSGADNEDSLFDDLRERLEVLINRARAAADRDGATDVTRPRVRPRVRLRRTDRSRI
ncbi:CGLAU_01105 family protein [Corynebacterium suedekumii]|nr:CGLAU_01105 family protein [Corynebacterium suedekumii]